MLVLLVCGGSGMRCDVVNLPQAVCSGASDASVAGY